jgi:hypothetical protein
MSRVITETQIRYPVLIYLPYVYWAQLLNTSTNLYVTGRGPSACVDLEQQPLSPRPRAGPVYMTVLSIVQWCKEM